ncbi:MAG: DUF134 domain-containing protein [Chloroflexota bacterium]
MARPRKRRRLGRAPRPAIYKPAGVPLDELRQVLLLPDELEALRLAHLEGLSQAGAAERMGISRSTFQRTLEHAHRQVTLALAEGQALNLESSLIESTPGAARRRDRQAPG